MNFLRKFNLFLGLAILFALGALSSPYDSGGGNIFLDPDNQLNVFRQISNNGILAVGMTLVILTAGIDLSVGSMMAFGTILTAMMLTLREVSPAVHMGGAALAAAVFLATAAASGPLARRTNLPAARPAGWALGIVLAAAAVYWTRRQSGAGFSPLGVLLCVPFVTAALGSVSGTLIAKGKIQPFVATLAMMIVVLGLSRVTAGEGRYVYQIYYQGPSVIAGMPVAAPGFKILSEKAFGFFPVPALFFLAALIAAHVVLVKTRLGRHVFAIGGNEQAAYLSGIHVDRIKIAVYAASGWMAGLTGVLYASQFSQGSTDAGKYMELDAIAAAVIGGASLMGGRGSIVGTFVGVLILGYLNNILQLNRIDPNVQLLLKGIIIVSAVLLQEGRTGQWAASVKRRLSKGEPSS